ncbi:reverse transcriptase, partial [Phytophthora megakarya]
VPDHPPLDNPPSDNPPLDCRPLEVASVASDGSDLSSIADDDFMSHVVTVMKALDDQDPGVSDITTADLPLVEDPAKRDEDSAAVLKDQPNTSDLELTWDEDQDYDEYVYYHEGSDLYAEDVDGQLAVLPEVPATTEDVRIEDIQLCGSDNQTSEEIDRLRQRIWKFRHLLIGKGNALPPAAQGVVCDIDVGGARPIALKCRKLRIQFREKLAELINGLLLTQLMVYPMPQINDLLEDLESTLWYCSLDMAIGFWVAKMTDRARLISVFITPFGLFEWNRMPLGLKNAPQIYQRMIDNALYGFTRIPKMAGDLERLDVFEDGEPEDPGKPSVLGRRSYIDDILVPADNWDQLCDRVEDLLEACDKWNLSISVVKSFWGMPKVEYLGHKVSHNGLEAIRRISIYASVLYELREIDYTAMEMGMNRSQIQLALASESPDPGMLTKDPASPQPSDPELSDQDPNLGSQGQTPDCVEASSPEKDYLADLDPRWIHAHRSFKVLKEKIA